MGFEKLTDVLRLIQSKNKAFKQRLGEAHAVSYWESAVGATIAKHARALRVIKGVLMVEVDHPAWKNELHHRKAQILSLLNQAAKAGNSAESESILDIQFFETRR